MSSIKQAFNAYGTFSCSVASLANGSARQSSVIDNSSGLYLDAFVKFKVKTNSNTGVTSLGYIEVFAFATVNSGGFFTDNAGATDAAITPSAAIRIGTFPAIANNTTYYSQAMSVAEAFGGKLPYKWGIIIKNSTGAALDGTEASHDKVYQEMYLTNA